MSSAKRGHDVSCPYPGTSRNTTIGGPRQRYNQVMTQQALDLLQKALSLSEEERAALADSLLASLDISVEEGAKKAWEEEISRRIVDIDSGKAKMIPWEEVREELSSRLKHDK